MVLSFCQASCENEDFYQGLKLAEDPDLKELANQGKNALLEAKFFYAGQSARYMFDRPVASVRRDIQQHVEKVPDAKTLVSGLTGEQSPVAVNHLLMNGAIVSKFAVHLLSKKVSKEFLEMAYGQDICSDNPTFHGWVFELDICGRIRRAAGSGSRMSFVPLDGGNAESIPVKAIFEFYEEKEIAQLKDLAKKLLEGTVWLLPTKYNQGCFDFIFIQLAAEKQIHLRTINTTIAHKHSIKWVYVQRVIQALVAGGFEVVSHQHWGVLCEGVNTDQGSFQWGDEEGTMAAYSNCGELRLLATKKLQD